MDTDSDRDTALMQAETHLKARGIVQKGDVYAITCGEPMGAPGGTNMLKICRVGSFFFFPPPFFFFLRVKNKQK